MKIQYEIEIEVIDLDLEKNEVEWGEKEEYLLNTCWLSLVIDKFIRDFELSEDSRYFDEDSGEWENDSLIVKRIGKTKILNEDRNMIVVEFGLWSNGIPCMRKGFYEKQ